MSPQSTNQLQMNSLWLLLFLIILFFCCLYFPFIIAKFTNFWDNMNYYIISFYASLIYIVFCLLFFMIVYLVLCCVTNTKNYVCSGFRFRKTERLPLNSILFFHFLILLLFLRLINQLLEYSAFEGYSKTNS